MMDWEPRVGMRVVCVDEVESYGLLRRGSVYTVSDVLTGGHIWSYRYNVVGIGILLAEISGPLPEGKLCFSPVRFRPLDERRLDIFRSILTKAPTEKEPA